MTQYIDKSSIITEIRRLLHNAEAYLKYHHNKNDELVYSFKHQKLTMCELLSFIDSLEVKEVDLEKEICPHKENLLMCCHNCPNF